MYGQQKNMIVDMGGQCLNQRFGEKNDLANMALIFARSFDLLLANTFFRKKDEHNRCFPVQSDNDIFVKIVKRFEQMV